MINGNTFVYWRMSTDLNVRCCFSTKGVIVDVDQQVQKRLQIVDDYSSSENDSDDESNDEQVEQQKENQIDSDNDENIIDIHTLSSNQPNKINLDVSTLICLVSELTHGGHVYRYPNKWLEVPAELERASRLAPKLEKYMQGHCLSSFDVFVDTLPTRSACEISSCSAQVKNYSYVKQRTKSSMPS
jgi:hypothetical protein